MRECPGCEMSDLGVSVEAGEVCARRKCDHGDATPDSAASFGTGGCDCDRHQHLLLHDLSAVTVVAAVCVVPEARDALAGHVLPAVHDVHAVHDVLAQLAVAAVHDVPAVHAVHAAAAAHAEYAVAAVAAEHAVAAVGAVHVAAAVHAAHAVPDLARKIEGRHHRRSPIRHCHRSYPGGQA